MCLTIKAYSSGLLQVRLDVVKPMEIATQQDLYRLDALHEDTEINWWHSTTKTFSFHFHQMTDRNII